MVVGLLPLMAVEGVMRLADWGNVNEVEDPFIGFMGIQPLFERNRSTGRDEIPVSRQALFRPESFAAVKSPDELRIFCLGGSTVQGRPYAIETSFTTWLELSLRAADPRRKWQVINCGGVSYASYRLVPIMREVLDYQPDLFVLYAGHNEFLEDRTYHHVKRTPRLLANIHSSMTECRTYNGLRSLALRLSGQLNARARLPADADPLLDYRGGFESYRRDDAWRDATIAHFRFSLRQMLRLARSANVPLLLCNPVANIRDVPPFKSEPSDRLSADQRAAVHQLVTAAQADVDVARRLDLLDQALAIDDRHPRALYLLGRLHLEQAQTDRAKRTLLRAKDNDICPLRILEQMHDVIQRLAAEHRVPLVDIRRSFESQSPGGIPGNQWLLDHVHPTIEGHQRIAQALVREMVRLQLVEPVTGWESRRATLFREHRQSLPADYFAEAETRMQGLRRWTSGRAFQAK